MEYARKYRLSFRGSMAFVRVHSMSLRQWLAAWIAPKRQASDRIAEPRTEIVVMTSKQRNAYNALVKYRTARSLPAPTASEYADYLSGKTHLVSIRTKRAKI